MYAFLHKYNILQRLSGSIGDGLEMVAQRGGEVSLFADTLDVVLANQLCVALHEQGFGPDGLQRSRSRSVIWNSIFQE